MHSPYRSRIFSWQPQTSCKLLRGFDMGDIYFVPTQKPPAVAQAETRRYPSKVYLASKI